MVLICESNNLEDYLVELEEVNFSHSLIRACALELFAGVQDEVSKIKIAFEYVRDKVPHSWDIKGHVVTCNASEVLKYNEGICYAKSNLLAALLRAEEIPVGFCYQRLILFNTPEEGFCIHALNAVYVADLARWIRLDARGNKSGIDAQFSTEDEKLAFAVRKELGEIDYPTIYRRPNRKTIEVLQKYDDIQELYLTKLPERI